MYLLQAKYTKTWITITWSRNLALLRAMIKDCEDFDRDFAEIAPAACVYRVMQLQLRWPFMKDVTNEVSGM